MDKKTIGTWIVHHTKKLLEFTNNQDFEDIELAGKCGIFLSNLSASDEQSDLTPDKVNATAKVSQIKKTEIETIKNVLQNARLIDVGADGSISVLGLTTSTVLLHTSDIFTETSPNNFQKASIELSENISDLPKEEKILKEYISNSHNLAASETSELFQQVESFGLVDYETVKDDTKLYFNGNLFKKDNLDKVSKVLSSLSSEDVTKTAELDSILNQNGCIPIEDASIILGNQLLSKLQSIGMYYFNAVSNLREAKIFITKPAAFSKYGNPFEEDALDLAKSFVAALFYGMHYRTSPRGKITFLSALLNKLIRGDEVGPATAIGEDYSILELNRVVQLRHSHGSRFYMKLLKKDIGILALQVLEQGDAAEQSVISTINSASVSNYTGPERNRIYTRKKQNTQSKKAVVELLRTFRK